MPENAEAIRARIASITELAAALAGASARDIAEAIVTLETTASALRELYTAAALREARHEP